MSLFERKGDRMASSAITFADNVESVIKNDPNADNEAAAFQTYHAYLGAYGYGNNADIDYVRCRLDAADNTREPIEETWMAKI